MPVPRSKVALSLPLALPPIRMEKPSGDVSFFTVPAGWAGRFWPPLPG